MPTLREMTDAIASQEATLREGGGAAGRERQNRLGRLTARERLQKLLDPDAPVLELGLWAAWQMYPDYGDVPAAGVVAVIGSIQGRMMLVVANDATVKAGAFFPQTSKKVLRAQKIAMHFRLPIVYLVDSAGVFLPLQDEIFPDEDDFGRIFRNNAVISASGIPQYAAVMGNCIAGGAYLPVLCDTVLMTEGSQMCLAGPALVKAAIGQTVDPEELGGAKMHAEISGTVDYRDADDEACLARLRSLIELLPQPPTKSLLPRGGEGGRRPDEGVARGRGSDRDSSSVKRSPPHPNPLPHGGEGTGKDIAPANDAQHIYNLVSGTERTEYDMRELLACIVDADSLIEYRADYGKTVVTAFAMIGGHAVGIVANQRMRVQTAGHRLQIGGVMYDDSAEKAARFVMDCNQQGTPLVFFQDVQGFMVGRESEQSGIIRSGAKLVNAVSNSVVPKFTIIVGGSYGAGNYAMCGKAYDPWLILAWPNARYAVMGAEQAADTLLSLRVREAERSGQKLTDEKKKELRDEIRQRYESQTDIRYGAARGWVDAIIPPHDTRLWLEAALNMIPDVPKPEFRLGVFQV